MDYATAEQVSKFLQGAEDADETALALAISAASRFIDNFCEVNAGFFAKAGDTATDKTVAGSGVFLLRLPPYLPGTLESISSEGLEIDLEDYTLRGNVPLQFLIAPGRVYFSEDAYFTFRAQWGFAEIPADIVQATITMAIKMFRETDVATVKMADTETQLTQNVPSIVRAICDGYRRMNLYLAVI